MIDMTIEKLVDLMNNSSISRRALILGASGIGLISNSGCTIASNESVTLNSVKSLPKPILASEVYAAKLDEMFPLPAIPYKKIQTRYHRQLVENSTGAPAGTLVVDTAKHFLYLTLEDGKAIRYGVGLGRAGFEWSGNGVIQYKRSWPRWTPPNEMIERQPELSPFSAANGGMSPGLANPLGARALYIFQDGVDTLYRIHGSPDWASIGKSVSSGCVRMINQDVIDLFNRVSNKTPIIVSGIGEST